MGDTVTFLRARVSSLCTLRLQDGLLVKYEFIGCAGAKPLWLLSLSSQSLNKPFIEPLCFSLSLRTTVSDKRCVLS